MRAAAVAAHRERVIALSELLRGLPFHVPDSFDPEEHARIRNMWSDMALHFAVILSPHVIEETGHDGGDLAVIDKRTLFVSGTPFDLA